MFPRATISGSDAPVERAKVAAIAVIAGLALVAEEYFAAPKFPHVARISNITHEGKLKGDNLATDGNEIYALELDK